MWDIMRKAVFFTLGLIVITIMNVKAGDLESRWIDHSITADGNLDDWQGMPFESYKEYATYAVCNDSDNLYIAIRFKDPMWLRSIRQGGLTVWVNNKGKKDKIIGFKYNGGPDREEMEKFMEKSGRKPQTGTGRMMERESGMSDSVEVMFAVVEKDWWYQPTPIDKNGANGPAVAFGIENGIFCYEYVIPLAESGNKFYGGNIDLKKKIRIGFEWGGVERKDKPRGGMRIGGTGPDGGMPGGGMGGPGGGMGGGPRGMNRGDFEKYMEKQEFWIKAELATAGSL